mgnify:CR=1 FL=1
MLICAIQNIIINELVYFTVVIQDTYYSMECNFTESLRCSSDQLAQSSSRHFAFCETVLARLRVLHKTNSSLFNHNKAIFMKITICGSIAFYEKMQEVKKQLENMGYEVKLPPIEVRNGEGKLISVQEYYKIRKGNSDHTGWIGERKSEAIMTHFKKVEWSDAILVLNYDKNEVKGYVGGNTLMEIGLAFFLKKKIYFLNDIPELSYKEELSGMKPVVIRGDLNKIV